MSPWQTCSAAAKTTSWDHGFPTGEHGHYYNATGAFEENFRIPLLLLWRGRLAAERMRSGAHSQIDVAPTILALLRISVGTHFMGQPLIGGAPPEPRPVYLSQPYDGIYLVSLRYPWKYARHLRLDREILYNLETDPQEKQNLIDDARGKAWLAPLREDLGAIYLNQRLIEANRIWPAP